MARTYEFEQAEVPTVVVRGSDEPNPFTDMVKAIADGRSARTFLLWGKGNDVPEGTKREDALSVDPKRNKELGTVIRFLNAAGNEQETPVTIKKSIMQHHGNGAAKSATDVMLRVWAVTKQRRPRKDGENGAENTATETTASTTPTPATPAKPGPRSKTA